MIVHSRTHIMHGTVCVAVMCAALHAATAACAQQPPSGKQRQEQDKACIENVCFDREITIGNKNVPLRGLGRVKFFTYNLYTAAFYIDKEHHTVEEVLSQGPKRLVIEYHHPFKKSDFAKYSLAQLKANPAIDLRAITERFKFLTSRMQDVAAGDRYEIIYTPGSGTELFFNGVSKVLIPGEDFAKAYFGIWLSDHPISPGLRMHLLRGIKQAERDT